MRQRPAAQIKREADEIHEAVPAHGERADREGDRIELGMCPHVKGEENRCGYNCARDYKSRRIDIGSYKPAGDFLMALNRRSHLITQGVARSPNRAMLRAVGFGDGDFEKPIVGVAQRSLEHEPVQRRHTAARRPRDGGAARSGRDAAGLRRADHHRRHRHGHRGDEVFARVARSDRRRDRDRGERPGDGRRARLRRMRQEHARRHDRHGAHERARHLRLRGHDQARQVERPGPHHRERVRSRRRLRRGPHERRGFRRDREERVSHASARAAGCTPRTRCRPRSKRSA